ncbi:MAG: hypothetical protein KAG61_09705 [Bacteriovoracaceae bacterium]|nr:hypothetical protein [Bacteriovoracaceae bacterium]
MAKISELNNKQLLMNIQKYQKIIDQLLSERSKRLNAGGPENELLTPNELKEKQAELTKEMSMEQFSLNLADDDIEAIENVKEVESAKDQEEDDLVRVTTLLRLSQDQLAELKQAKEEQKDENKVVKRPTPKKASCSTFSKKKLKITK